MCEECCQNSKKGIVESLVALGALAGGLYYLFGTDNGKKIQKQIKKKGAEAAKNLQELLEELEEKSHEYREKVEEIAASVKDEAEKKWETGSEMAKQELGDRLDQVLTQSEELLEKGQKVTQSLHRDLKGKFTKK